MKFYFKKNDKGDIEVQISKGTSSIDFDYIEMLKQLSGNNTIDYDWGDLDEEEKAKLKELLDKIKEAVDAGLARPLE